jgi:hypothetical protein
VAVYEKQTDLLFDSAVRLPHFKKLMKVISLLSLSSLKHALHEATGWRFLTTEGGWKQKESAQ